MRKPVPEVETPMADAPPKQNGDDGGAITALRATDIDPSPVKTVVEIVGPAQAIEVLSTKDRGQNRTAGRDS
jgi:hypothetical protein